MTLVDIKDNDLIVAELERQLYLEYQKNKKNEKKLMEILEQNFELNDILFRKEALVSCQKELISDLQNQISNLSIKRVNVLSRAKVYFETAFANIFG